MAEREAFGVWGGTPALPPAHLSAEPTVSAGGSSAQPDGVRCAACALRGTACPLSGDTPSHKVRLLRQRLTVCDAAVPWAPRGPARGTGPEKARS